MDHTHFCTDHLATPIFFFEIYGLTRSRKCFFYFYAILQPHHSNFQKHRSTNKVFIIQQPHYKYCIFNHLTKCIGADQAFFSVTPNALERVGPFFLSHHLILLPSLSSGRAMSYPLASPNVLKLFSLTKLQYTHCVTSLKSSQ